jgi:hypothetical protein
MEPSGRNQWQPLADANEAGIAKQAKTVAVSCAQLPIGPHGKRGSTVRVRQRASRDLQQLFDLRQPAERRLHPRRSRGPYVTVPTR